MSVNKTRALVMLLAFLTLTVSVTVVWMVVTMFIVVNKISDIQDDNTSRSKETKSAALAAEQSSKDSAETLRLIQDCLDPSGVCNQENQAQTAAIIAEFNKSVTRAAIYAAACAEDPEPQSPKEIEACVFRLLAQDDS